MKIEFPESPRAWSLRDWNNFWPDNDDPIVEAEVLYENEGVWVILSDSRKRVNTHPHSVFVALVGHTGGDYELIQADRGYAGEWETDWWGWRCQGEGFTREECEREAEDLVKLWTARFERWRELADRWRRVRMQQRRILRDVARDEKLP